MVFVGDEMCFVVNAVKYIVLYVWAVTDEIKSIEKEMSTYKVSEVIMQYVRKLEIKGHSI